MTEIIKSIRVFVLYFLPCLFVYLVAKYGFFSLYSVFNAFAIKIPAVTNYSVCTQSQDSIKSLHFFNVFYSIAAAAVLAKKINISQKEVGIKAVLISLPLVAYALLLMLFGFELPSADGTGGFIATYYCSSETVSFLVLSLFSAGASTFYLMFFIFMYLFIKTKANKV